VTLDSVELFAADGLGEGLVLEQGLGQIFSEFEAADGTVSCGAVATS